MLVSGVCDGEDGEDIMFIFIFDVKKGASHKNYQESFLYLSI